MYWRILPRKMRLITSIRQDKRRDRYARFVKPSRSTIGFIPNIPVTQELDKRFFLEAFTYDNELKEVDVARQLYEQFIDKFPKDELADDAKFLLKNLGKSDDEILQELGTENQ